MTKLYSDSGHSGDRLLGDTLSGGRFVCGISDEALRMLPKVLLARKGAPVRLHTASGVHELTAEGMTAPAVTRTPDENEDWDLRLEADR